MTDTQTGRVGQGLLNRAHVRARILARAAVLRPHWQCTRVSGEALQQLELKVASMIDQALTHHPTKGQTFKQVF